MNRIDIDTLSTPATRALAEAERDLPGFIAEYEAQARVDAAAMSVAALREELDDNAPSNTKKDELIDRYVKQDVAKTLYARELKERRLEARRDVAIAEAINGLMDKSDAADATLREITAENSGVAMYAKLRWVLDDAFAAQQAAIWARRVVREMKDGAELRDAVLSVLGKALEEIFGFPSSMNANGLGSVMKTDPLVQARAAVLFRDTVTRFLPDMQVPIDMIRF